MKKFALSKICNFASRIMECILVKGADACSYYFQIEAFVIIQVFVEFFLSLSRFYCKLRTLRDWRIKRIIIPEKKLHLQANKFVVKTPTALTPPLAGYLHELALETKKKNNFLFKCDGARKKKTYFNVQVKHVAAQCQVNTRQRKSQSPDSS